MKREEFLGKLKTGLDRLPPDELESVLDYYNEIFLDAGEENEEQTAQSLGNTDDIIRQIYVENGIDPDGRPEFIMGDAVDNRSANFQYNECAGNYNKGGKTGMTFLSKLLLLILLFPIWFPIATVVCALLFSLAVTVAALVFSLGIVGIVFSVVGIVTIFIAPPIGLVTAGIGLILTGLLTLIFRPVCSSVWRGLTGFVNWCVSGVRRLFIGRRSF